MAKWSERKSVGRKKKRGRRTKQEVIEVFGSETAGKWFDSRSKSLTMLTPLRWYSSQSFRSSTDGFDCGEESSSTRRWHHSCQRNRATKGEKKGKKKHHILIYSRHLERQEKESFHLQKTSYRLQNCDSAIFAKGLWMRERRGTSWLLHDEQKGCRNVAGEQRRLPRGLCSH